MFSRGGRFVLAAARRQVLQQPHGRDVLVRKFGLHLLPVTDAPYGAPDDWMSPLPFPLRRCMSTEVLGGQVDEERRRLLNRILYRSRQRGYLELDLLLGKWATDHIEQLDDNELGALVEVLEEENPDLLSWITGQSDAPEKIARNPVFLAIQKQVSERLTEYSSTETRAQQGQPWVRGWDDNRKVGGPHVGNQ